MKHIYIKFKNTLYEMKKSLSRCMILILTLDYYEEDEENS